MSDMLTTADAERELGCQPWQVAHVFERGLLPEPPRVLRVRVILPRDLPRVRRALGRAGYLKPLGVIG